MIDAGKSRVDIIAVYRYIITKEINTGDCIRNACICRQWLVISVARIRFRYAVMMMNCVT